MTATAEENEILSESLGTEHNGPFFLARGKWVLSFQATSWDTASIGLRSIMSSDTDDFTSDTALKDPLDGSGATVLAITANRGDLVIQGPTYIDPYVSSIGSATGIVMKYAYAGNR